MKVTDLKLTNLQPLALSVLLDDSTTVELIEHGDGEAFMRIGESPVERFMAMPVETVAPEGEEAKPFDINAFYQAFIEFDLKQVLIPDENTLMGFRPVEVQLFATLPSVADFEGNPVMDMVTVEHSYSAKTMMPALRKDLLVGYTRAKVEDTTVGHEFYFADVMNLIRGYSDQFNCQWQVRVTNGSLLLTAAYEGTRDNRHLEMNKLLDERFGFRNQ